MLIYIVDASPHSREIVSAVSVYITLETGAKLDKNRENVSQKYVV